MTCARMFRNAGLAIFLMALSACGGATNNLTVADASYRAPLVEGSAGVAYFSVTSPVADRIVGISSPNADRIEIHQTAMNGGLSAMHHVESVELPAGQPVVFGPAGLHLMVISPHPQPAGATFRIQIVLESGRVETVDLPVTKPGG